MELSPKQLQHLAFLSRLELAPEREAPLRDELNEVLAYFEQLQAVDTAGVLPLQRPLAPSEQLRPDHPGKPLPQAEVLALAPAHEGGLVRIPRTLDTE